MTHTYITVTRWIFNSKNNEIYGRFEIMDCSDTENGMPINMKEAVIEVLNIEKETEKAINVTVTCSRIDSDDNCTWKIWIPKSQIIKMEEV